MSLLAHSPVDALRNLPLPLTVRVLVVSAALCRSRRSCRRGRKGGGIGTGFYQRDLVPYQEVQQTSSLVEWRPPKRKQQSD